MPVATNFRCPKITPGPWQWTVGDHSALDDVNNFYIKGLSLAQVMQLLWNSSKVRVQWSVNWFRPYCAGHSNQLEINDSYDETLIGSIINLDDGALTDSNTAPEPSGRVCGNSMADWGLADEWMFGFDYQEWDDGSYYLSQGFDVQAVIYDPELDEWAILVFFALNFYTRYWYPDLVTPTRDDYPISGGWATMYCKFSPTVPGDFLHDYFLKATVSGTFFGVSRNVYIFLPGTGASPCGDETFSASFAISVTEEYTYN